MKTEVGKWILTDVDTGQYGTQIDEYGLVYEFKEPFINFGNPVTINLSDYTNEQLEHCINAYGYTNYKSTDDLRSMLELCGEEANWITAECLFEMEEEPSK